MGSRKYVSFTLIAIVIGFMIAIQFQTVKEPIVRDTRDTWQLREDLLKEKELQLKLIREVRSNEEKVAKYETELKQSKEQILRDTLDELKAEAGLTEAKGYGVIITVEPAFEEIVIGSIVSEISPELLRRLVNELNMYGAVDMAIDNQRVINTTVIRDINNETKIDGYSLNAMPFDIKVIAENKKAAEKLYNRMQVSKAADEFFIDNLKLKVTMPNELITIPPYVNTIRVREMEPVKATEGGNS